MIQPNELRIGNWIKRGNHIAAWHEGDFDKPFKIEYISNSEDYMALLKLSEPIPITPELLQKCGFKESLIDADPIDGYYYSLEVNNEKHCDLTFSSRDENGFLEVVLFPYDNWFRFRYLHQLQNLYFALTETELLINL